MVTYEGTEVNEVPTDQIWYSLNIRIMAVTDKIETYGSTLIQSPKLDEELDFQVVSRSFSSKQFLHMKNNFPAKKPPHITITKISKEHIQTETKETIWQLVPWELAQLPGCSCEGRKWF